jgi:lipoprotein-anchoring transpeptidase ErfK/SrfK
VGLERRGVHGDQRIDGVEGDSVGRSGFGIHGTNEPDSIGRNMSMGCIRLGDADIAMVYSMLEPGQSEIRVVP